MGKRTMATKKAHSKKSLLAERNSLFQLPTACFEMITLWLSSLSRYPPFTMHTADIQFIEEDEEDDTFL